MRDLLEKYTGRLYAPEGTGDVTPPSGDTNAHPVATAPWAGATDGWKVGEAGKEVDWYETIPEPEAREHVKVKGYKNPAELALANYSLTKMQRGATDVMGVPKAGDENAWNETYTKLGRPPTAGDYKLTFGEGVKVDDAMLKFGKDFMHAAGVPQDRAQVLADKWNTFVADQMTGQTTKDQEANTAALTELEQRWGAELNENKAAGKRVVDSLKLSTELMDKVEANIGAAPLVELLAMIGKAVGSEGAFKGGGGGGDPNDPANLTKEQAAARITALNGDEAFMKKYRDARAEGHAEALALMEKLYAKAG